VEGRSGDAGGDGDALLRGDLVTSGVVALAFALEPLADSDDSDSRLLSLSGLAESDGTSFGEDADGEAAFEVDAGSCWAFVEGVEGFAFADDDDTRPGD
jgi:hypothetical protein